MRGQDPDVTAEDELRSMRQQLHIYEAVSTAAGDAHAVLDVLLDSSDPDAARHALELRYGFTQEQAWAVIEVQLRRMTELDRHKIEQRREELMSRLAALEAEVDGG